MSEGQPSKLEYESPAPSNRSPIPPEGYLGYRGASHAEAKGLGCGGLIAVAVISLMIVFGLLWWIGSKMPH